MAVSKYILLTIDLEEFDLPHEYGNYYPFWKQMSFTNQGLERANTLLDKYDIRSTFFITTEYAMANPFAVKQIGTKHEIASHACHHSIFDIRDPLKSKQILERISQQNIYGFRMPRMMKTDLSELKRAGYIYDSSINPTYIPSRYNYFFKPRTLFKDRLTGLFVIPVSVSPIIRFPLFWLSFKNIPFEIYSYLCKYTLDTDNYLHLYFHSWEFADIKSLKIPGYIKRIDGVTLIAKLEKLLIYLKMHAEYITITEFLTIKKLI